MIDPIVRKANQTVSVCTAKIGESLDNIETNLLNVLRDEMENVTLVCEMESAKSKNVLEKISNTSLHMVEQFSSAEALKIFRNVDVISQSLLKVHGFRKDAGFDCFDILEKYPNTRGRNGVYNITAPSSKPEPVYCDMTTNYGGWTVSFFFRRFSLLYTFIYLHTYSRTVVKICFNIDFLVSSLICCTHILLMVCFEYLTDDSAESEWIGGLLPKLGRIRVWIC